MGHEHTWEAHRRRALHPVFPPCSPGGYLRLALPDRQEVVGGHLVQADAAEGGRAEAVERGHVADAPARVARLQRRVEPAELTAAGCELAVGGGRRRAAGGGGGRRAAAHAALESEVGLPSMRKGP
eukprot:scaffold108850_cov60-Phaeocystis_antarctica.AAC.1